DGDVRHHLVRQRVDSYNGVPVGHGRPYCTRSGRDELRSTQPGVSYSDARDELVRRRIDANDSASVVVRDPGAPRREVDSFGPNVAGRVTGAAVVVREL